MFHGHIFGGAYVKGKNKFKKCMGLYTGMRGFILGILQYIMILRFRLETIYFDNIEYYYILWNKFILSSVEEGIK